LSHSDKKAEKGAIYENIFGGNCGGTIGANAAQKRNRGMIRRRKTSNLLNKSISDTQLAFICANLADSLVFLVKIISRQILEIEFQKTTKISNLASIYFLNF
jgi:hypothetical protein